jgi:putative intracellular protease/amidase
MSNAKRVLIVVTSHAVIPSSGKPTGLWFEEFSTPYLAFREAGLDVTVASTQGGAAPIDPRSLLVPAGAEEAYAALQQTAAVEQLDAGDYDAIFFPGGHGTMFDLPENQGLQRLLRDFAEADKVIAAVCHGPAGLVGATYADGSPLVAGKTVTAFTNAEEDAAQFTQDMPFLLETRLRELGAKFVAGADWSDHIEQDGNLITGQNPQSSASIAQALVRALQPVAV